MTSGFLTVTEWLVLFHLFRYIASKTYYFGVGGGTDDFVRVVEGDSLFSVETAYKSVGGVQREVLKMSWRSQ